jgi:hypothetical protein
MKMRCKELFNFAVVFRSPNPIYSVGPDLPYAHGRQIGQFPGPNGKIP